MKPAERIDRPIVLNRTGIQLLFPRRSVEASAEVVLRLAPRARVVIEFDLLLGDGAQHELQSQEYIDILTDDGTSVRAVVGGEWTLGGQKVSGVLVPVTQPVTALRSTDRISRCKFALINFPSLWGAGDIHRPTEKDGVSILVQRMPLHADSWTVEITGVDSVAVLDILLRRTGGSAITHAGSITRSDGSDFALEELDVLLDGLHLFLSFVRGSYCGLAFLSGQDSERKTVWKEWGSREVEPWHGPLSSWVHPGQSEALSAVFSGFWTRFTDPAWDDTVSRVLRWYLRSNESSDSVVGIILTQAALERLSHAANNKRSGAPGDRIASALAKAGIDPQVPTQCPELMKLARRHKWSHGPHALVEVRNNLAHPNNRLGPVAAETYAEARHLGQWYVELMLLHQFDYSGPYRNRLRGAAGDSPPIEDVPWAVKSGAKS